MKPARCIPTLIVLGTMVLVASVGCSCLELRSHAESNCQLPCHRVPTEAAIVKVGGEVYETREIELGTTGLTLKAAVMAAGGARESAVEQANTASNADNEAKLKRLVQIARALGKSELHNNLIDQTKDDPQLPKEKIKWTLEEVKAERTKQEGEISQLIDELSVSYLDTELRTIVRHQKNTGFFEESVNLVDSLPQFFEDPKDDYVRELDAAIKTGNDLLSNASESEKRTSLRSIRTDFFVTLERPTDAPPLTYYFPYDLVTAGMASDIELRGGDVVNVIDVRASDLMPPDASPNSAKNVVIQGYVEQPGITEGIANIGGVQSRSTPTIDDPRSVWMLVRPGSTGRSQQVFVLPDRMLGTNGAAADAPTKAGDIYVYTTLPQVPIVFESLLSQTMRSEKQRCLEKLHEMKAERKKECRSRLECARDTISETLNCIPMP